MQPSKVGRLLASDAGLQPVIAKAREISALSKLCFEFLPPGLARLVRAINFNDHPGNRQLVLLAASPAAAAKLKMLSEALTVYLLQERAQVNSVSVRVQPGPGEGVEAAPKQAHLTRQALQELVALYQRLPESAFRKALKTLLDRHNLNP